MNNMLALIGAAAFGSVIGWSASLAIQGHSKFGLGQLSALIGAVGGGAVLALFQSQDLFSAYSIGLAATFFLQRFLGYKPVSVLLQKEIEKTH